MTTLGVGHRPVGRREHVDTTRRSGGADAGEVGAHERGPVRGGQDELHPPHAIEYKAAGRGSTALLPFKGQNMVRTDKVKLLSVTLDRELRFKVHLADKAGKATKAALALSRMRRL